MVGQSSISNHWLSGGGEEEAPGWSLADVPAEAGATVLIKHNEAWDHKVFHLIPGSQEGGRLVGLAEEKGL